MDDPVWAIQKINTQKKRGKKEEPVPCLTNVPASPVQSSRLFGPRRFFLLFFFSGQALSFVAFLLPRHGREKVEEKREGKKKGRSTVYNNFITVREKKKREKRREKKKKKRGEEKGS